MTEGSAAESAKPTTTTTAAAATTTTTTATTMTKTTNEKYDILLNNFQIKKKRYRVLLNCDHVVWERLHSKREGATAEQTKAKHEANGEQSELRDKRAFYGDSSAVLHLSELIGVVKGSSKAATLRRRTPVQPNACLDVPPAPSAATPTDQYLTLHYAERVVKSAADCNRWCVRTLTLYNSDPYIIHQWHALLVRLLDAAVSRCRVRRLLVFVNPYGGRREGLQTYERHCKPLFQLAGIDAACVVSQRANQIRDMLMSHDLAPYDAVCCVGGDGTVAEVINGLIFRAIRDLGMDVRRPAYIPKPALPVGIIPAGSTDTVAYTLHGTSDPRTAAIHLLLGQRRGLDICSVQNPLGIVRFCASVLSYGYLGDVAAKSEKYRWMGTKRYEFTGVKAFFLNRGYDAEIRLQTPETPTAVESPPATDVPATPADDSVCCADCQRCSVASLTAQLEAHTNNSALGGEETEEEEEELPTSSNASLFAHRSLDEGEETAPSPTPDCDSEGAGEAPKDVEGGENDPTLSEKPRPSLCSYPLIASQASTATGDRPQPPWRVVKGRFFMISGANIACACSKSPNGIARFGHLGDGYLDLIVVRKTSLLNNVRFLINTMGRKGDIRNLPFVEVYRTRKFAFRTPHSGAGEECESVRGSTHPIAESFPDSDAEDEQNSRWNCDGEVVGDLDIVMRSHCQLVDVFMRGPHTYTAPPKAGAGRRKLCCCLGAA